MYVYLNECRHVWLMAKKKNIPFTQFRSIRFLRHGIEHVIKQ
ncbi:hypothetical protein ALTERO38_50294 [Alteromonas sp. 38]|nr:hypothetical protein ALTER154_80976 [Alteromonas sp. 154]VXB27700.1 hypothetical protein ALTERO38_50294 [Alteromonas sp. 38]